jgi:LacI family transcriptional regulator
MAVSLDKTGVDLHLHVYWNKDNFCSSLVDGAVFVDLIGNEDQMRRLINEDLPFVVMNRRCEDEQLSKVSYVAVDNRKAAFDATEFLINHGHKRIVHLAGDLRVQCAMDRLIGYKQALEKNSIGVKENLIKETNFSRKEAREQLDKIFANSEIPTAIFCCSDEVACEVLAFCDEKKIQVPREVSIIGFDDNPQCIYGNVMLTTVRQPLAKMSAMAVEILRNQIEKKSPPVQVMLDAELIIRDTVAFL